jgi:hypothetical protein
VSATDAKPDEYMVNFFVYEMNPTMHEMIVCS